jgi:hypothetical protein
VLDGKTVRVVLVDSGGADADGSESLENPGQNRGLCRVFSEL